MDLSSPKPCCPSTVPALCPLPHRHFLPWHIHPLPALPSQAAKPDLNQGSSFFPPLFSHPYPSLAATAPGMAAVTLLMSQVGWARSLRGAAAPASGDFPSTPPHGRSHVPGGLTSGGESLEVTLGCLGSACSNNSHFSLPSGKDDLGSV